MSAAERTARRRAQLLDAGLEEFGTRGVLATGVRDVCRQAGLTDRYFYESFRDGNALFVAVFDRATEHLYDVVRAALAAAEPTRAAQVRAVIEAYVRALADDPRLARVVFVEAAGAGPEVERHMRSTLRTFARLVEDAVRPHVPAGTDLRCGALMVVGGIERLMIEWQDGQLEVDIDGVVDYLVGVLLAGGLFAPAKAAA